MLVQPSMAWRLLMLHCESVSLSLSADAGKGCMWWFSEIEKKKTHKNSLCNPEENIIIGLTNIKVLRDICQDLSKTTLFRDYIRKENAYESANDLEEGQMHYVNTPGPRIHFLLEWGKKPLERTMFSLLPPTIVQCRKVREVSIWTKEWKGWKKVQAFRYVNRTFHRDMIWKLQFNMVSW